MTWQCCHKLRQVESDFFQFAAIVKGDVCSTHINKDADYICILQRLLVSTGKLGRRGILKSRLKKPFCCSIVHSLSLRWTQTKSFIHIPRTKPSFSSIKPSLIIPWIKHMLYTLAKNVVVLLFRRWQGSYCSSSGWHTKDSVMFLKRERVF